MAFSLFGKRGPDPEEKDDSKGLAALDGDPAPVEKRGFFDRMRQAVTRTRETFAESIGSVLALTREVDESSLADLEAVLLAADIGSETTLKVIENLRQRGLRQGIESGDELKRLLKLELKAVLDGVATAVVTPEAPPEVVMMVGVNGTGKTTTSGKLAAFYRGRRAGRCYCARRIRFGRRRLSSWRCGRRGRGADYQDEDGRRSFGSALRCVYGGEGSGDGRADCGYGGALAYEDGPDEGAGQDAADSGAACAGGSAPDAAGDGCDDRTERIAAGAAVYGGREGDGDCADETGWDGEGRDRAGDCDGAGAAGESLWGWERRWKIFCRSIVGRLWIRW